MAAEPKIDQLLVIGVGLIGGSFALALRQAGVVRSIVGVGRSEKNLETAVQLGVIDRYSTRLAEEVPASDVIFVATPVLATEAVFDRIAQADYHDSIITDAGSAKHCVVRAAQKKFSADYRGFVAAHPIAGREHSGVSAATVDLYEGKRTIITPSQQSGEQAIQTVRYLWQAAGAVVSEMDCTTHDELVSASSHLPHLIAFGLVNYIAGHANSDACFDLAASGFYDFTRIASSDPTMWRDISLANSKAINRELRGYIENLEKMAAHISAGEGESLQELFDVAKTSRDHYLAK